MGFKWLTARSVESDEGFTVSADAPMRDVLVRYTEQGKCICLQGEFIHGDLEGYGVGVSFFPGWRETPWDAPHDKDPIASEDWLRIRNNITNALAFMNCKAKFR